MAERTLAARIVRRAVRVGVSVSPVLSVSLAAYLELLARWNRKINLTALDVAAPSDEAIDRLIIEPLVAARRVLPSDSLCIDIGSGGGSPAIPMKLAVPAIRLVLVEVKIRKSAFLREAARHLELQDVEVENRRFEDLLSRSELHEAASLVTIRAVRVDRKLIGGIQAFLRPGGRVFWFDASNVSSTSNAVGPQVLPPLSDVSVEPLIPSLGSCLRILVKN